MNHTKINLTLISCLFFIVVFASSVKSLVKPGHSHPGLEKRRMKNKPDVPDSLETLLSYPGHFENYYKDNFEFRYSLLDVYKHSKFSINDPAVDKVIFGTEPGWLFFNDRAVDDVMGDYRNINQFSKTDLKQFTADLKVKQQWLASQGIEYLFVLAPSKHYVYLEYLPSKYQPIAQQNVKSQLAEALKQSPEINFLDLTETILQGKEEQRMFLKNDTHWTDYATNLAQHTLSKKLETLFPGQIETIKKPWSAFTKPLEHGGDLAQINGTLDLFPDTRHLPEFATCAEDLMPPKKATMDTFDTNCNKQLRTVVFRDSFFSNLQPFVSENLGLSRFVWQKMTFDTAEKHIKAVQPHVVIEEWIDRHLPRLSPAQ